MEYVTSSTGDLVTCPWRLWGEAEGLGKNQLIMWRAELAAAWESFWLWPTVCLWGSSIRRTALYSGEYIGGTGQHWHTLNHWPSWAECLSLTLTCMRVGVLPFAEISNGNLKYYFLSPSTILFFGRKENIKARQPWEEKKCDLE